MRTIKNRYHSEELNANYLIHTPTDPVFIRRRFETWLSPALKYESKDIQRRHFRTLGLAGFYQRIRRGSCAVRLIWLYVKEARKDCCGLYDASHKGLGALLMQMREGDFPMVSTN
ncbi:hypothetical protein Tco_0010008 [Tanacetum coccineum]